LSFWDACLDFANQNRCTLLERSETGFL